MWNIVLVWAWWTWMSGIAWLLHDLWYTNIVCIDGFQSELTDKLEKKWLQVIIGHGKYEPKIDDAFIYSEATVDSPEVTKARALSKEQKKIMLIMNYFQFLGEISKYFITVGFAGTNGKSSTTALGIYGAKQWLPNFGIGILWALVPDFNNQSYYLNPEHSDEIKVIFDFILTWKNFSSLKTRDSSLTKKFYFFVEACEYKRHFLNLDLDYAIITSLELDHTDYYKDMNDYLDAFKTLINKTKQKIIVPENINMDFPWSHPDKGGTGGLWKTIKVPIEKIDFRYIRGDHNNINWSLVMHLLNTLQPKDLSFYLSTIVSFHWLRRRMELLWKNKNGSPVYSDYGHMASSIELGYHSLRMKYPGKKIFVIFQPHQINRILLGRNDFIKALEPYDKIMIYDIYAARENRAELIKKFQTTHPWLHESMTLHDVWNEFAKSCKWTYTEDIQEIIKEIENTKDDWIVCIFSAWDIDYKIRQSTLIQKKE